MKDKDSKLIYEAYEAPKHRDGYDPTQEPGYGTAQAGPGRGAFEDAFWDALKRGDLEGAKRENEMLRTKVSIPGLDKYDYEGWNGVQIGIEKGISEEILRSFFYPDMGDMDWNAGYNYIMFGSGPGDDGAGAKGAMSRKE